MSNTLEEKPVTRIYNFEQGCKAYGRAMSSYAKPDYISELDEDTLILGWAEVSPSKPTRTGRPKGNFPRPDSRRRRSWFKRFRGLLQSSSKTKDAGKCVVPPRKPQAAAVFQIYKGFVDAIHEGFAYLILENHNGQRLDLEWDAADLTSRSIEERQPFILKTISSGSRFEYEFIPDHLLPLSGQMKQSIEELLSHYRATGELDSDGE